MAKHPRQFCVIFAIEMWERFGFYGMQALLVTFFIKEFRVSEASSEEIFGAFCALVYAFVCLGGYIGDHILGTHRTMSLGAVVLFAGYAMLAFAGMSGIYLGLALVVAGNAFFKANPSALIARLYDKNDPRLDGVFTLYYMAVNIGSFLALFLCPLIKNRFGYRGAFIASSSGMAIAVLNCLLWRKSLSSVGSEPDRRPLRIQALLLVLFVTVAMVALSVFFLQHLRVAHLTLYAGCGAVLCLFVREVAIADTTGRRSLLLCLVLVIVAVFFFIMYQQMPTSLNLLAAHNTDRRLLGLEVDPALFFSLNPFFIFLLSPLLAMLYSRLGARNHDLSLPAKFSAGMILYAGGYFTLVAALTWFAGERGLISGNWLIATYGLQSLGELLISGLGLAVVAKLAPQRSMGFMMGFWFMGMALAMVVGSKVAGLSGAPTEDATALTTLPLYRILYIELGFFSLVIGMILAVASPTLARLMPDESASGER